MSRYNKSSCIVILPLYKGKTKFMNFTKAVNFDKAARQFAMDS
jgi:hypothetical protein